jgi:hypothetical protein
MWGLAPIGIEISEQNNADLAYTLSSTGMPKPVLQIRAEDYGGGAVYKIAATTTLPDDIARVAEALEVAKGLVWRRVDTSEAYFWFVLLEAISVHLSPPNRVTSFRELFALARTFLARMAPYIEYEALLTPIAYGAALLENAHQRAGIFSYTEPQLGAGRINLIPIAGNYNGYGYEPVVVYPRSMINLCKRYIYETEFVDRVVDEATDRNVLRITCERYLVPVLPLIFYYRPEDKFTLPAVTIDATQAIDEISYVHGIYVLDNLRHAAAVH